MRKHQRTALLVVVIVLAIAGLVALFVVAPWHKASAPPTTQPTPVPSTTTPAPPTAGVVAAKVDNVTAARPQTGLSAATVVCTWNWSGTSATRCSPDVLSLSTPTFM